MDGEQGPCSRLHGWWVRRAYGLRTLPMDDGRRPR
jgi:hypothetical protein